MFKFSRAIKNVVTAFLVLSIPVSFLYPQELANELHYLQTKVHSTSKQAESEGSFFKSHKLITFDDFINFLDDLENDDLYNSITEREIKEITDLLIYLSTGAMFPGDLADQEILSLHNDIYELLYQNDAPFHYASTEMLDGKFQIAPADYMNDFEIIQCKGWFKKKCQQVKKFVVKHKKPILIGVGVVTVVTVVVVSVAVVGAASVATAATAIGSAAASTFNGEKSPMNENNSPLETSSAMPATANTALALETLEKSPEITNSLHEQAIYFREQLTNENYQPELEQQTDSFVEKARSLASGVAHAALHEVSEMAAFIPQIGDEIKEVTTKFFPETVIPDDSYLFADRSSQSLHDDYENIVTTGHTIIDNVFSTNQADQYSKGTLENQQDQIDQFGGSTYGILPHPGIISKSMDISKVRQSILSGSKTVAVAEELGYSTYDIAELKKTGSLEKNVCNSFDRVVNQPAMLESTRKTINAREILKPHRKKSLPEGKVRELIHSVGYKTFPRPKKALKNFRVMVTDEGAGMYYVHPDHGHTSIRVMPGKPHSPHPHQRFPYVIHKVNGDTFDKVGNVVLKDSPAAHIPLEDFLKIK